MKRFKRSVQILCKVCYFVAINDLQVKAVSDSLL